MSAILHVLSVLFCAVYVVLREMEEAAVGRIF